jgi:hypothetical protein
MHYMRTMYWSCRSIFTHSFWRYEAIFVALLIILMTAGHSTIFCRTNHFPALTRGLSSISLSVTFRGYSLVCLDTKQSLSIVLMVALIAGHFLSPGTEPFPPLTRGLRSISLFHNIGHFQQYFGALIWSISVRVISKISALLSHLPPYSWA